MKEKEKGLHKDALCHFIYNSKEGKELRVFNNCNFGMPMNIMWEGVLYKQVLGLAPLHNPNYKPNDGDLVHTILTKDEQYELAEIKLKKIVGQYRLKRQEFGKSQIKFLRNKFRKQTETVGKIVRLTKKNSGIILLP